VTDYREKIEELKRLVEGGGNSGWYFTLKDTALPLIEALQAELSVAWADCENESAPCRACAWCYDRLEGENRRLKAIEQAAIKLHAVEYHQSLDSFGEALRDLYDSLSITEGATK
jgi:hypothetical protein